MTDFLQLLIFGIVSGAIFALGGIGISLIYGILRFGHLAHGDMMTFGAYLALAAITALQLPVLAALPIAMIGTAAAAVALDWLFYRRFRRRPSVVLLISSFGLALVLRSVVQLIWGPGNHVYESGISIPYVIFDLRIKPDHLLIVASTVAIIAAFHLFLTYTRLGKAMRAMSDDPDLARISGVDTERVVMWTWAIGGALAAAGGVFLALDTQLNPLLCWNILLPMFAAAIVGGIGRPYGAIAGGLLIGIVEELSTAFIDPAYKPAVAFVIMVAVLLWRPTGILKGTT
jgi:branched-chain amino acid transport system permease protein/neutral amino acid transport system permease protein